MFKKPMPRPAVVKKPKDEKEMVGQFKSAVVSVGSKAPVLSRLVGKM
jgi:hypothetical protein